MDDLTPKTINPWKHIFLHPKETIEWVMENNPEQFYRKLFWVCSAFFYLTFLTDKSLQTGLLTLREPLFLWIILSPVLILLVMYAGIYIGTAFINFIAGLFGGEAPFKRAKEVLLWLNYPMGITLLGLPCLGFTDP